MSSTIATFLLLSITTGALTAGCNPSSVKAPSQQVTEVESEIAKFDSYLATDAEMKASKQADPQEFDRFRTRIVKVIQSGKSQEETQKEINVIANDFSRRNFHWHLRHASPSALKEYLTLRLNFMEKVSVISPDFLYSILVPDHPVTKEVSELSEEKREKIAAIYKQLTEQAAPIIVAPPSDKPIRQDAKLIKKNLKAIHERLSPMELTQLDKKGKPDADPDLFCEAYIHLYREGLKLPDVEIVQLFRELGDISLDDRVK